MTITGLSRRPSQEVLPFSSVLVRSEGGPELGMGHYERSVSLARALAPEVTVLTRDTRGLERWAAAREVTLQTVEGPGLALGDLAAIAGEREASLMIFDLFELAPEQLEDLAAAAAILPVVTYAGRERTEFVEQVAINPNRLAEGFDYTTRDQANTRFLIGPAYHPLRRAIQDAATGPLEQSARARRLLIALGGADPLGLSADILRAALRTPLEEIDVVLGVAASVESVTAVRAIAADPSVRGRVHVHQQLPEVVELMVAADLAIVGAGGMMQECFAVGVPVLALAQNEDQRVHLAPLAAEGLVRALDPNAPGDAARDEIAVLLGDQDTRTAMAWSGRRCVDGRGIERSVSAIIQRIAEAS